MVRVTRAGGRRQSALSSPQRHGLSVRSASASIDQHAHQEVCHLPDAEVMSADAGMTHIVQDAPDELVFTGGECAKHLIQALDACTLRVAHAVLLGASATSVMST